MSTEGRPPNMPGTPPGPPPPPPPAPESRMVRAGDVPPADYARIRMKMGVGTYGGFWSWRPQGRP